MSHLRQFLLTTKPTLFVWHRLPGSPLAGACCVRGRHPGVPRLREALISQAE